MTRTEKSPWANFRAAAAISSKGFASRFVVMRDISMASSITASATAKNTQMKDVQAPMIVVLSELTNTKPITAPVTAEVMGMATT